MSHDSGQDTDQLEDWLERTYKRSGIERWGREIGDSGSSSAIW